MMHIRHETPADRNVIHRLTKAAFDPMPFSDGDEAECVEKLREDGDLTLSLVAVDGDELVGHVAFSPVFLDDAFDDWYGLGPISVWPHLQQRGIGRALIHQGLSELKKNEARGCVLIGDPRYYSRFGFVGDGKICYRDLPINIVQWLGFGPTVPSGVLRYSAGLE